MHAPRASSPSVIVYCVDIGSVAKKRFGWARGAAGTAGESLTGSDPAELVTAVAQDLEHERAVALGFECPLFVPVPEDPNRLTAPRNGEGSRPWSAGAGASSLASGLTETVWTLRALRRSAPSSTAMFLNWETFSAAGKGLFLWEAFVTSRAKGSSHVHDAAIGVEMFLRAVPDVSGSNALPQDDNVHSLIGAALLRTGWSNDLTLLETPCVVIKA